MDKLNLSKQHTVIDLFAGCGGLSLGLEEAGFIPIYVNELNNDALETYLINRDKEYPYLRTDFFSNDIKDHIYKKDFFKKLKKKFKSKLNVERVDLIVGGPPCQGFSGIGHRRSYSVDKAQLPSNHLYEDMVYFIHKIKPKIFLFENVEGLLRSKWTKNGKKGEIFNDVLSTFKSLKNYNVKFSLVKAKDYGVPQNRPRVIIIGIDKKIRTKGEKDSIDALESGFLPMPTNDYPQLEDVFSDLIDKNFINGGETKNYPSSPKSNWQKKIRYNPYTKKEFQVGDELTDHEYSKHSDTVINRFNYMIKNNGKIDKKLKTKKFAQRLLPRTWMEKGPTITACSLPDDFVHYHQPRVPTVREWARLQTFPDWYKFFGKRTTGGIRRAGNPLEKNYYRELPKYTQIGNAVPVKLAYEIGKHLIKLIK